MKTFINVIDTEVIEAWKKQNLSKEDYNDVFYQSEFLRNNNAKIKDSIEEEPHISNNDFDHELIENHDRHNIELPSGYFEIELYDNYKTFDENFEFGKNKKYVLIEINGSKDVSVASIGSVIPTTQSKCIIDIEKVEDFSSLEFIPIDYDTLFGLRFLSFIKYNSNFFVCDERVMFEALLIKYKAFDFKPFFWSKEKIFEEVGIKKDRATKIIEKFIELEIITKQLIKTTIENRPMQINYYDLNPDKILELLPKIYVERDAINIHTEIKKYLIPVLKKK
jgi:hypothetical protein